MCVHQNTKKVMKMFTKVRFFEFWVQHLYFYETFQSAGPIPTAERVMKCRTKVPFENPPPASVRILYIRNHWNAHFLVGNLLIWYTKSIGSLWKTDMFKLM